MRVLFAGGGTGGHLYPGLAVARALVEIEPAVRPFFIGARRGIERDVLPRTEFPHVLLDLHPLYRAHPWKNWRTVRGAVSSRRALGALHRQEPPVALLATGGYAAGIAALHAAGRGVPVAVQEQNSHAGLTTRWIARLAREVYLGFPEAERGMPHAGAVFVDTGNPIEPPPVPYPDRAAARARWGFASDGGPVVLAFGGSQGARALNETVAALAREGLPADASLVWATGTGQFDAYASLDGPRVRVRPYLAPIAEAYAVADLAIARAGAMGTAELCAWGVPMLLVPLPTAAADHQAANARALAGAGAAGVIAQEALTPARLRAELAALLADPAGLARMAAAARARARPEAARRIAERLLALARNRASR